MTELWKAYKQITEALEDMVWQFSYRGVKDGKPIIHTGGLGSLEAAFIALEWDDPKYLPEEGYTCDIEDCVEQDTCGTSWGNLYLRLCRKHHRDSCQCKLRPPVKQYALDREARRGPDGILKGDE